MATRCTTCGLFVSALQSAVCAGCERRVCFRQCAVYSGAPFRFYCAACAFKLGRKIAAARFEAWTRFDEAGRVGHWLDFLPEVEEKGRKT